MKINILTETQTRKLVKEELERFEDGFWTELDKLRKRIVELEIKNMENKNIKAIGKNRK